MRPGFLPVKDLDLLAWSLSLTQNLSVDPPAFGVPVEDAELFDDAHAAFAEAMRHVVPTHRSRVTVELKNAARLALENEARRINALVRGSGLANAKALLLLGLTVYKKTYRRVGPPTDRAFIQVMSVLGTQMRLRLYTYGIESTGLPPDVTGATVFQWIGEGQPPHDLTQWTLAAHATRSRITVRIAETPGTKVHFCAYYLSRKGERGPLGPTTYTYAMGGMIAPSLAA